MNTRLTVISLSLAFVAAACGSDEPVSTSAPVGITMKVPSGATADDLVLEHKSINTESANPWAKFVADAQEFLGADPSVIELDSVSIALLPSSSNIADLSELFDGEMSVMFEMNTSKNVYPAASGLVPASDAGTVVILEPSFQYADLTEEDVSGLLSGSFSVVLTGGAQTDFPSLDADADLEITFEFSAFE